MSRKQLQDAIRCNFASTGINRLIRMTPVAGVVSHTPPVAVMAVTMPMFCANLTLLRDEVSPVHKMYTCRV